MKKRFRLLTSLLLLSSLISSCSSVGPQKPKPADPRQIVDSIVEGEYVVTVDEDNSIIEQGAVAIKDGLIVSVGTQQQIYAEFDSIEILPGDDRILLPGLINGHSHMAMTLLRGLADDLDLMTWLNDFIFPAEVRFVDEEFVRVGTQLACWEMMLGGTTTVVDMYYYPGDCRCH